MSESEIELFKAITRRLIALEKEFPGVTFTADIPGIGSTAGRMVPLFLEEVP